MTSDSPARPAPVVYVTLAAIMLVFLVVRAPLMYRQPGGQDEDSYSVPGYTVATEGIPRLPYVPERRRESVFFKADKVLTTLPPAFFYWQAPWFWVLPAGYGTARLPSAAAGLATIWLVFQLARRMTKDDSTALGAAGLYSLSRVLFFPATTARPDMLCCLFGIAAVLVAWEWSRAPSTRRLVGCGLLCGLGLLTHPFAIVYCLQIGVWVLWRSRNWKRSTINGAILTTTALVILSAWLPLILMDVDAFREQFIGNVFDRPGPGLAARAVWPWPYVSVQAGRFWDLAGPWQTVLTAAGLVAVVGAAIRRRTSGLVALAVLSASSVYLMIACLGRHSSQGYWCYPGALLMICAAWTCSQLADRLAGKWSRLRPAIWAAVVAAMLPGFGLRAWTAHVRHWDDSTYDSRQFTRAIVRDFPQDERLLVDPAYIFDAWLIHPNLLLASETDLYFQASRHDFDAMIAGRYGFDNDLPQRLGTEPIATFGDRSDLFACYAEVHVKRSGNSERPTSNIER